MVGWVEKPIGQLYSISGGWPASRAQLSDRGYFYLHYGDIHASNKAYIDTEKDKSVIPRLNIPLNKVSSDLLLQDGDIVFVDASEDDIGTSKHVVIRNVDEIPFIAGLHTIVAKPLSNETDKAFREYCFQTEEVRRQFKFYSAGTKVTGISKNNIKRINLVYPESLTEQKAIASALADMDELIISLENLIEKKKAIKQGAVQKLISGKTRINGFTTEWIKVTIGDVTDVFSGGTPSTSNANYWGGDIPWMSSGELNDKKILSVNGRITEQGLTASSTHYIPVGCVLLGLAGQGKTRGTAAYNLIPLCTNQSIAAIYPADNKFCSLFLFYVLDSKYNELRELSSGDGGRGGLTKGLIKSLSVHMPKDLEEQQAIATLLSDMDGEIEALTQKLEKCQQIKQGMMQELLTGRIRLVDTASKKQRKEKKVSREKTAVQPQGHNEHFHEAVILSAVVSLFASEKYPLGRFRRQKLAYLLHRHAQESTQGFLKKAAGPYNPTIRYKDEKIALKAEYVAERGNGKFVKGEKTNEAVNYFVQWYGAEAIEWLKQFQFRKNDELEVLTTVAEAIADLKRNSLPITVESIKQVIQANPEWRPKLDKDYFNDINIQAAMRESQKLFA